MTGGAVKGGVEKREDAVDRRRSDRPDAHRGLFVPDLESFETLNENRFFRS
jgi:hypothetical protein